MKLITTISFGILTSFAVLTACSSDAPQELDADKDEVQKRKKKQPIDDCGQDLKDLEEWVQAMNKKRNKGETPDMKEGEALVKKLQAANLADNCQKILEEKIKSMSTESADKQNALDECQAKCPKSPPPAKNKCKNDCGEKHK